MDNMFHVGVVESRNDPLKLGRLKVRFFGVHDEDHAVIPTESLPWAVCLTQGSMISGIGSHPKYVEGDWVIGMFLDKNFYQRPFIMGAFSAITEGGQFPFGDPNQNYPLEDHLNESDLPRLARGDDRETDESLTARREAKLEAIPTANGDTWDQPEPEGGGTSLYPLNRVMKSESGIIVEIDDSPDSSRIHLYHPSGSFIEVTDQGIKTDRTENDKYSITMGTENAYVHDNMNVTIGGNVNLLVHGDMTTEVQGNRTTTIMGNDTLEVNGTINYSCGKGANIHGETGLTMTSQKTLSIGASDIMAYAKGTFSGEVNAWGVQTITWDVEASGNAKIDATRIDLN